MPRARSAGSVLQTTTTNPARKPFEMKVFEPLIAYWLPCRSARVRIAWRSDPAPGSVIAIAPTSSPLARRGRYRRFWSSVPWFNR